VLGCVDGPGGMQFVFVDCYGTLDGMDLRFAFTEKEGSTEIKD
jgi:hypothetical protein